MKKKWIPIVALSLLLVPILVWFVWHGGSPKPLIKEDAPVPPAARGSANVLRYPEGAPQLLMIESQAIPASPVPLTDALNARLVYDEDATARIGVAISGRITAIKAAPGDSVKAGQVLAEIDSPDFGTANADLNKARADEERKRLVFERAKDLVQGEAIALKDWEAARADLALAKAETARAEQRLKNLNPRGLAIQGQRVSLTSPMDGVVTERTATQALEVNPALPAPLFVVTDPRRLWLMIDLPENLLASVKLGGPVEVESDAYPGARFPAKVVQLGRLVDINTRRVTVRARLDNPELKLLSEMFVRAYLLQDSGVGVRVPNSAIVNQGAYVFVYVQTAAGEFKRRKVTLLTRGGEFSYVGDGLKGGERIVTTGTLLLDAELTARASDKP